MCFSAYQITDEDSAEVSKLLKAIGDFERISDHSVNVLGSIEELREKKIEFSDDAKEELHVLCEALSEIPERTIDAFEKNDTTAALCIEPLEQVIDRLKSKLRDSHIVRLKNGDCTVEAGFIWADLLTNMERTSDHCSNIAVCIIDAAQQTLTIHESVRSLKHDDPIYKEHFSVFCDKYM